MKKLYVSDPTVPVPKRTLYFWKSRSQQDALGDKNYNETNNPKDGGQNLENIYEDFASQNEDTPKNDVQISEKVDADIVTDSEIVDESKIACNDHDYVDTVDSGGSLVPEEQNFYFTEQSNIENNYESDSDEFIISSSSSCSESETSESSDTEEVIELDKNEQFKFTEQQLQSLSVLAFILRHNLTGVAANDLLCLLKVISSDSLTLSATKYEELLSKIDHVDFKVCHYCPCCQSVFPENPDIFKCITSNCRGYRYKGGLLAQTRPNRQSCCFFVVADIKSQLKNLLEQDGLLEKIGNVKYQARLKKLTKSSSISDITDGKYYRTLLEDGNFLANENSISGMFNTDGIPLYSSSSVKLWPIFLAINEIPLAQRFSRDNMILVGIWQGKGNPPFLQYLTAFGEEMCSLYHSGITITRGNESLNIKLGIFLGVVDLQAKGYVLNMTMHNGEYGCCTCEEPGKSVKQGKGYARCYPYRERKKRFPFRNSEHIKYTVGPKATSEKRLKGICGISGLMSMPWFDVVLGIVPDYMHGVLMGVTKTLMCKWFSPTQCKKPFFIGKHLTSISKRLSSIKPPDYVERLPRNLEKHYAHLKATELQAWLLYYALPCLNGYLPAVYLKHFALLSEGIYLLLGDYITESDILRAEQLLDSFYKSFSDLYGEGSCGLNIHNLGAHLVFYVRLWGPLFSWSCFGFEDWNAAILQSVHGTGDVTRQVLYHVNAHLQLKKAFERMSSCSEKDYISRMIRLSRQWKISLVATDCTIAGGVTKFLNGRAQHKDLILGATEEKDFTNLRKVLRIQCGKERFYSREYRRLKKRICNFALTRKGEIISIHYFVYNQIKKLVFAIAQVFVIKNDCFMFDDGGCHILRVCSTDTNVAIPACEIQEKLFFLSVLQSQYIIRMPNMHGHGLFK